MYEYRVSREDVLAALTFAANLVDKEEFHPLPAMS